ncbi:MAG TPA: DNA polymerase II large subunit, partial [Candidatus Thermoplasmatota archaeon]|nr:DNA polymerase II large subunit [Candidatus Thermoplasmatota archaeon]
MRSTGYFADSVEDAEDVDPDALEDYDAEPPEVLLKDSEGASPRMKAYFESLIRGCLHEYALAERCRALGLDPETRVEIPRAEDLAARVEELVGPKGVAGRIRELSREMHREAVSLLVAKEVAAGAFGRYDTREAALDAAIRTGLAILTEGILVAPLEGIAGVRILKNDDGTDCVAVSFAGPIRAAGGTGQALSVLIADVVRRELGIGKYRPTAGEVDRFKEEIPAYKMAQHLQYTPTPQEIEAIARGCPVMIDGEKTEDAEVSGNRDLPRIETNHLRGGACLVLAEGLILKAPKVQKHVQKLGLDGWEFISHFVNKSAAPAGAAQGSMAGRRPAIEPNPKYMLELVAGRPVLSHPSRPGGWRLRYGRSRTGGLATTSVHPASMVLCDDFLAVGTQMKIERPGKATAVTPCEGIEGPIALLHNGSLVEVDSVAHAREVHPAVKSIVDLGEILIPFGEFVENNKTLPQASYCVEWWEQEAEKAGATPVERGVPVTARDAVALAERLGVPLHPRYNLFWHDLAAADVDRLAAVVETT